MRATLIVTLFGALTADYGVLSIPLIPNFAIVAWHSVDGCHCTFEKNQSKDAT